MIECCSSSVAKLRRSSEKGIRGRHTTSERKALIASAQPWDGHGLRLSQICAVRFTFKGTPRSSFWAECSKPFIWPDPPPFPTPSPSATPLLAHRPCLMPPCLPVPFPPHQPSAQFWTLIMSQMDLNYRGYANYHLLGVCRY